MTTAMAAGLPKTAQRTPMSVVNLPESYLANLDTRETRRGH